MINYSEILKILKELLDAKRHRTKRSPTFVENSKLTKSEETDLLCSGAEGRVSIRDKISRVALAHLLAWQEINAGSKSKNGSKIQNFYHQINYNAGKLDPLAGILSRHLSRGAELYSI